MPNPHEPTEPAGMSPVRWQRVNEIFHAANEYAPTERNVFLTQACAADAPLRAEVEKLLAADAPASDSRFLDPAAVNVRGLVDAIDGPAADGETETAGPPAADPLRFALEGYEILRELSHGGQGVVYQAVQKTTKRKVAIKLLLEGQFASKSTRRRFEREIELVAQLKHPNIISIFHSGETADGRPYYVMDYVRGLPLDRYVREKKLTLEEALKLFATVCNAVQYAHQRGIIHRDLKPSNILVDANGTPFVLDFGLAKSLAAPVDTVMTLTHAAIGTLPYMSPEQTRGNPDEIDTRTDIYALGVILYEILTGHYPYPVAGQMADVFKHITETPPTPPSRAWKSDTGVTQRSRKRLRAGQCPIDDEVQTIVLRLLAKERERRYQSAGELAKDLAHYLAGEPIDAKRDSVGYVLRKQLKRHRVAAVIAASFVLVITVGFLTTLTYWRQAAVERDRALHAQRRADVEREAAWSAKDAEARARASAEEQADEAGRQRDKAEWQSYLANVTAADAALQANDTATARRRLDAAPERFRNWEWHYLDAASDFSLAVLRGHENWVNSAVFSPDGSRVVTASWDWTARVWDADTGEEMAILRGHKSVVFSAAFSPDGSRVVTASLDRTARVWDAATGEEVAILRGHEREVHYAAFSPDGSRLVTASWDRTARLWDAATGAEVAIFRGHNKQLNSAAFSPDGSRVLTASHDRTATVWNAATGKEVAILRGHETEVHCAAFSPDGSRVLTASGDSTARVWDTGTWAEVAVLRGHEHMVNSAAFSPDGSRVVTASSDKTARVWDAITAEESVILRGHQGFVQSAAFSPDGLRVVTASSDKTARLWDTATGEEVAILRGHADGVSSAAFSPDGSRVVTASSDQSARVWNTATGEEVAILRGHERGVASAAFSPDGARVVTASGDSTARVWDAGTGAELAVLRGHEDMVNSAAFSPDGSRVVTASWDSTARVWNAATSEEVAILRGHKNLFSAAFSPDGSRVVTASLDSTARVWDSVPFKVRLAERRALRAAEPEARRIVAQTVGDRGDYSRAAAQIRANPKIDETVRRVALNMLLSQAVAERDDEGDHGRDAHATKAAEWRAKLDSPTSRPASQPDSGSAGDSP